MAFDVETPVLARLRSQMSRGELILFLGAGFSLAARTPLRTPLPNVTELAKELWRIAFPGEPWDESATLGDAFEAARSRVAGSARSLLNQRLTVDAGSLPTSYRTWFDAPWSRCYTLNIDDLEQAVARRFEVRRKVVSVSATSDRRVGEGPGPYLEVIHLNGLIGDALDELTFTQTDYARRQVAPDAWYITCAADLLTRPVVFVGTSLNEATLWQYLEFRRRRGERGAAELRPGSYLVVPELNRARQAALRELNVDWLPMTAGEFEAQVLERVRPAFESGHAELYARHQANVRRSAPQLVTDLAAESPPTEQTDYLLGQEPRWSDLQSGRAIRRECDDSVLDAARSVLSGATTGPLIIDGTAGSGKSTSLMRLALVLSAEGIPTYWVDERSNIDPSRIRSAIVATEGRVAVLVDDADIWGAIASGWARELPQIRQGILFAAAVRSHRFEGLFDKETLLGLEAVQVTMPPLADGDIDALVQTLDRHNRLGVLKGKSQAERSEAFRSQAGRQLLVAMIQATSGKLFREKVFDEFSSLVDKQRIIYAIIALVHSQRFSIDRDEVLLAAHGDDNSWLNALEALARRHLVTRDDVHSGYEVRHRTIAEELVNAMEFRPLTRDILAGITFAFANKIAPNMPRGSRPWRRLIRFVNHAFILRTTTAENGREIYAQLETLLNWDYHYWLQRGSLEVEAGNLELATNFLDQARSLAPGQRSVETEYAYLLMKKAARNPGGPEARDMFDEGKTYLEGLILERGKTDSYPYHVLGSQGLAYARQAFLPEIEKRALLRRLMLTVKSGAEYHPKETELRSLASDIERDWLETATR